MKLFVCLCILIASADAILLKLLAGGASFNNPHPINHERYNNRNPSSNIIVLKVINPRNGPVGGPNFGYNNKVAEPQIIKLIHQRSPSASAISPNAIHPNAIHPNSIHPNSIHHNAIHPNAAASEVFQVIHQRPQSPIRAPIPAPAKVIRIIHENSGSSDGSLIAAGSAPANICENGHRQYPIQPEPHANGAQNILFPPFQSPPFQSPPFQSPPYYSPPAQQYNAPISQQNNLSSQYLPPIPQNNAPAPAISSNSAHIPAQVYGPPHQ